jgi:hypothetical protein
VKQVEERPGEPCITTNRTLKFQPNYFLFKFREFKVSKAVG